MNALMNDAALHTIEQIEAFLTGTALVEFRFENTAAGYTWIQATLPVSEFPRPGAKPAPTRITTGHAFSQS